MFVVLDMFFYVPCPHNASSISKALVECLKSFNLDEKVITITLDNCSTNDVVMDVLQEKLNSTKLVWEECICICVVVPTF